MKIYLPQTRMPEAGLIFVALVLAAVMPAVSESQAGRDSGGTSGAAQRPDYETYGEAGATKMQKVAQGRQSVYSELADYLVRLFELSEKPGIGIDIGGGPGDLIVHLVKRTSQFYWINTDINTWCARPFAKNTLKENIAHRTGFVFADVCALPFRDNYADVVVSRGSYQFWPDLERGLSEILRVLNSGGLAFIGRGVAPTMPEAQVRKLAKAGRIGGPKYDPDTDAERFRNLMRKLGIQQFEVIRHKPEDPDLNYGVWLYMRKP
ncbi:MAG: methyltransferase domain-containing protein [Phycisphaerae bacterium]|nr:methyltransferase domain-containing protein [Phycisphaerae bacterium]